MKALRETKLFQIVILILILQLQIGAKAKKRVKVQEAVDPQGGHLKQAADHGDSFSASDSIAMETSDGSEVTEPKEYENYPTYPKVDDGGVSGVGSGAVEGVEAYAGSEYENNVGDSNMVGNYRNNYYKDSSPVPEQYTGNVHGYYSPYYGYIPGLKNPTYEYFPNYDYKNYYSTFSRRDNAPSGDRYGYKSGSEPYYSNRNHKQVGSDAEAYQAEAYHKPAAAAPSQSYYNPDFGYDRPGPVSAHNSGLGFMPEPGRGLEFGGMAMASEHGNSYGGGGGGGWGKTAKSYHGGGHKKVQHVVLKEKYYSGVNNGLGLLTYLSLLTLLATNMRYISNQTNSINVASYGMTGTTFGRKKRSLLDNQVDIPEDGGFGKGESILLTVLPSLNVIAQVSQGVIPMECAYQEVCNANKILATELGPKGRTVATILSSGVNRVMEGKNSSPELASRLYRAGLIGRNQHICSKAYPTCPALRRGGAPSIPLAFNYAGQFKT